jgi:hypothetical protein
MEVDVEETLKQEEVGQTQASAGDVKKEEARGVGKPSGGYSIAKAEGKCQVCSRVIAPGEKLLAALRETPVAMERVDVCTECWGGFDKTGLLGFWQTTMHAPSAKKKVFVDDDVLCELFARLSEAEEAAKVNFRFVLGLILMRKRMIIYEDTRQEEGKEIWNVRFKGRDDRLDLLNPKLDEQQVMEVSQQLGEILNEEL